MSWIKWNKWDLWDLTLWSFLRPWPKLQHNISRSRSTRQQNDLVKALPPAATAHFLSGCGPGALAWLSAMPSEDELRLTNEDFRIVFKFSPRITRFSAR